MENADRRIWSVDDILSSPKPVKSNYGPMKLLPRGNHLPHGPLLPRVNQIAVPLATSHSGNCDVDLSPSPSLLARPVGSQFPLQNTAVSNILGNQQPTFTEIGARSAESLPSSPNESIDSLNSSGNESAEFDPDASFHDVDLDILERIANMDF